MTDIDNCLNLPYTITVRKDEDGDFVARVEELQGCTAHGSTRAEAISCLEDVQRAWITDALEKGDPIPAPNAQDELPSGKWLQRVPRTLHRKLIDEARRDGASLNQFVATLLAEAVGTRNSLPVRGWPQHRWDSVELVVPQSIYAVIGSIPSPEPIRAVTFTYPMETDVRSDNDDRN